MTSKNPANLIFEDNSAALAKPDYYMLVTLDMTKALKSYKSSLYSFEWMHTDSTIKDISELSDTEQEKRKMVEAVINASLPLKRPILGIGMLDNIEIGSGRAEFMVAAAKGASTITVHIPKANEKDFKAFLAS